MKIESIHAIHFILFGLDFSGPCPPLTVCHIPAFLRDDSQMTQRRAACAHTMGVMGNSKKEGTR